MPIDQLELFHALREERGQGLLAQLAQAPLSDDDVLPVLERYRDSYPPELVRAAVALTMLRRRAGAKFARAAAMYFTREGLEMASAEPVARHTARRFAGLPRVFDLCCGIGGDALALAPLVNELTAVERDPLALAMAQANLHVYAVDAPVRFVMAEVGEFLATAPSSSAIFIDPSRRQSADSRRVSRRPEEYSPSLSWCLALTNAAPAVAIKVSPALDYDEALHEMPAEVELISLRGECKEAMLWLGTLRSCTRRATVLPEDVTLTDEGTVSTAIGEVADWLYEPDAAVIRAHLVQRLAGECTLHRLDAEIAYLSGAREIRSPLLTGYRVRAVLPWNLKRLNAALTARGIGHPIIKKRGFPLTPEALRPHLKLKGAAHATLICTRQQGKPIVIIAD